MHIVKTGAIRVPSNKTMWCIPHTWNHIKFDFVRFSKIIYDILTQYVVNWSLKYVNLASFLIEFMEKWKKNTK